MATYRGNDGSHMAPLQNAATAGGAGLFLLTASFDEDVDSNPTVLADAPFPFRIITAFAVATAAGDGAGTVAVDNGGNTAITAFACDTDASINYAASIDDTYRKVAKGGSVELTLVQGATGDIYILCARDES